MKKHAQPAVLLSALGLLLSGCVFQDPGAHWAPQGSDSRAEYQAPAAGDGQPRAPAELTGESGLGDYLAYAALNNPGLEAAFYDWKAALERVPQAESLPDPRFTYRYFIREVETRVGAQRQGFSLSQTFPWFGKLALRGGAAAEAARAEQQRFQAAKLKLFQQVKD